MKRNDPVLPDQVEIDLWAAFVRSRPCRARFPRHLDESPGWFGSNHWPATSRPSVPDRRDIPGNAFSRMAAHPRRIEAQPHSSCLQRVPCLQRVQGTPAFARRERQKPYSTDVKRQIISFGRQFGRQLGGSASSPLIRQDKPYIGEFLRIPAESRSFPFLSRERKKTEICRLAANRGHISMVTAGYSTLDSSRKCSGCVDFAKRANSANRDVEQSDRQGCSPNCRSLSLPRNDTLDRQPRISSRP